MTAVQGGQVNRRGGGALIGIVAGGQGEWVDVSPPGEHAKRWRNTRAGCFFGPTRGTGRFDRPRPGGFEGQGAAQVLEVRDVRLWSIPWIGMILILLPALEWTARRLWGLA